MAESKFGEIKFTDADVLNPDEFPGTGVGCDNYKAFIFTDHGFTLAVVFAENEREALDLTADRGKLDRYKVEGSDLVDYPDGEGLDYLGNAGLEYDIESLGVDVLADVPFSYCALFNEAMKNG